MIITKPLTKLKKVHTKKLSAKAKHVEADRAKNGWIRKNIYDKRVLG
jgi:ribosomal protein S30